jgi:hypothetical protein
MPSANAMCPIDQRPRTGGFGADMGTKRRSISQSKMAGAVDDKINVAPAKLPPGQVTTWCTQRARIFDIRLHGRRVAHCTVIQQMALQPGPASLPGLPNQTASMGLGPVKSTHLAVAEAGNLVILGLEKWAAESVQEI